MNRGSFVLILAIAAMLATPAIVAAAEPALSATVIPGQEIDLAGSGFPSDADVLLAITRNGVDAGTQTVTTDASGTFSATIAAGPGRGGAYTITATSGSASATVEAVAVETAGGLQSTPPPTDMASDLAVHSVPAGGWPIEVIAVLVGLLAGAAVYRRRVKASAG
jgi:hypothetical protein